MPYTAVDVEEEYIAPGSGNDAKGPAPRPLSRWRTFWRAASSCCRDNHYRRLSIISVVCGLTCVGVIALKYSVKAKERQRLDPDRASYFALKARKFSIISIVAFASIIAVVPILMALVSYLVTLQD
ncbi:unnamed protein product [Knipowitschia caucasica]